MQLRLDVNLVLHSATKFYNDRAYRIMCFIEEIYPVALTLASRTIRLIQDLRKLSDLAMEEKSTPRNDTHLVPVSVGLGEKI